MLEIKIDADELIAALNANTAALKMASPEIELLEPREDLTPAKKAAITRAANKKVKDAKAAISTEPPATATPSVAAGPAAVAIQPAAPAPAVRLSELPLAAEPTGAVAVAAVAGTDTLDFKQVQEYAMTVSKVMGTRSAEIAEAMHAQFLDAAGQPVGRLSDLQQGDWPRFVGVLQALQATVVEGA